MKIRIVPASEVSAAKGLDAKPYVDLTHDVDIAIARSEKTVANAQDRLARLRAERARRLDGCRTMFPDATGHFK